MMIKEKRVPYRWSPDLEELFRKAYGKAIQRERLTKEQYLERIMRAGIKQVEKEK